MILTIKQIWRLELQAAFEVLGYRAPALTSIQIEAKKWAKKGEYCSSIALRCAADLGMEPLDLAKNLHTKIPEISLSANAYLNFYCEPKMLWQWLLGLNVAKLNPDCSEQKTLRYYRKRLDLLLPTSSVKEVKFEDFLLLNDLDYQLGLAFADFLDDYYVLKKTEKAWGTFFQMLQAYFNQMVFIAEDMQITCARGALINKIHLFLSYF